MGEFAKQNEAQLLPGALDGKCGRYMGRRSVFLPGEICDSRRRRYARILMYKAAEVSRSHITSIFFFLEEGPNIRVQRLNCKVSTNAKMTANPFFLADFCRKIGRNPKVRQESRVECCTENGREMTRTNDYSRKHCK